MKKGVLIVISGPSGSGKGSIVKELLQDIQYALSVSVTTRPPREFEVEGEHYFFRTEEEFKRMIEAGELLEYTNFCNNFYGTPKVYLEEQLTAGRNIILEIEVEGAMNVKRIYPDAVFIFIVPPTMDVLEERLRLRGSEDDETIKRRLLEAENELSSIKNYDYVVVNDVLETAIADIKTIISAEHMASKRFALEIDN